LKNERSIGTSQLIEAQDEERRRLSRELHDSAGQQISLAIMDLDFIAQKAEALSPEVCSALSECSALMRQALADVRTFSYALYPPMLEELGLVPAIRAFCEGFSKRSGIQVKSEVPDGVPRMSKGWEMALFHLIKEGLTNVRRHSQSLQARVYIHLNGANALVRVENEGSGFPALTSNGIDPAKVGVGINSVRERIGMVGGQVSLYSRANRTILEATLPLAGAAARP
jgi:two-component system NarL family sensor kinase